MTVLVTGANGYVGRALSVELLARGLPIRAVARSAGRLPTGVECQAIGGIDGSSDWRRLLAGCDAVVHLAGRAHVLAEGAADPLAEFRRVNVQGAVNLARQALACGVRRFVFVSSIGVNGAQTSARPFFADDAPAPSTPYAVSKLEAEIGLKALSGNDRMELVIVRPPLVYGPDAPGNFGAMLRWLRRGVPLPLGAVQNRRSFVALANLNDLLANCLSHPAAANRTFLVSDDEDVSTPDLLRRIGQRLGRRPWLVPVPLSCLRLAATVLGRQADLQRLCGSLQVDIGATKALLNWRPPLTLDQGLEKLVRGSGCETAV